MNIGKLYQINNYYWLLYPSKDKAATAAEAAHTVTTAAARNAAASAAYFSKHFKSNVSYISPNSIFCLLEKDERYCKILSTDGNIGWIILADWSKKDLEEVTA